MSGRPCSWSGCTAVIGRGERYCQQHAPRAETLHRENVRAYDRTRGWTKAFYNSAAWEAVRKQVLEAHPVCQAEGCTEWGRDVDHITPLRQAPEKALIISNLQSLCPFHHKAKSMRERQRRA